MKKIILFVFLAVSISCSNDDEQYLDGQLTGEWYLTNASCFCAFDESIDLQDFTLRFENSGNILHLNNPTESYFYIAESGSYTYSLQGNIISIAGLNTSYSYEFEGANLILNLIDDHAIADDELSLMYQRK